MSERRIQSSASLRAESSNGKRVLTGIAAAYNVPTRIGDFHEIIAPRAFTNALRRGDDVRFLINHDPNLVLGRVKNGTLQLRESAKGLEFSVTLPDTQVASDFYALVKRGDISECSFAFRVDGKDGEDWSEAYDCGDEDCCASGSRATPLRTLKNLRLFDASGVTYPAYTQGTSVSALPGYHENLSDDPNKDEDDEDWTPEASGARVSIEARSRAAAIIAKRTAPRLSDAEWLAAAQRKLAEVDGEWTASAQRRLKNAEQAIRVSDTVGDLSLASQAARDLAFSEDVRITKRNARYLRHPHTFEGTGTQYLEWLDAFLKG